MQKRQRFSELLRISQGAFNLIACQTHQIASLISTEASLGTGEKTPREILVAANLVTKDN